jgi:hypothetical protein
MKFTTEIAATILLLAGVSAQAQKYVPPAPPPITVVTDSKLFCKVDEFVVVKGPAGAVKKCAGLIEAADQPTKSGETCKEHGLAKGRECLKWSKAEQLQVKLKFTEQFGANKNFSTWVCGLDNQGGSTCP